MAEALVSKILFVLLKLFLWLIDKLSQLFMVFAGLRSVEYQGENSTVLQVFFGNKMINTVYWGMALISIALCIGFAIFAVTRKMFDVSGRVQSSIGRILTDMLKSIFIILSMSAILNLTITATDILMRQTNSLFNNAYGSSTDYTVEFTDDQLSAMGRVLLTVANYGSNPSYKSRYNLNACFNEIRPDLLYLKNQGVLDYDYPIHTYDGDRITGDVNTWQSVCQNLGNAADLRFELSADEYNEHVAKSIEDTLDVMDKDASFKPLKSFTVKGSGVSSSDAPFDRIIFLTAGLDAANNKQFNGGKASLTDSLRRPWYSGAKSLYDKEYEVNGKVVEWDSNDEIDRDFDTGFSKYNYLIAFVLCIATTLSLLTILLNLGGRIFNLLMLYIVAPPTLASAPLDGGGKTKQWTTSFIVQVLSVFGSVIAMRLLLIFVPVIYDPELVFFSDNAILNFVAKAALLLAAFAGAQKATVLVNGILSDTAGMTSAQAADFSSTAAQLLGTGGMIARKVGRAAGGVAGFATKPVQNLAKKGYNNSLGRAVNAWRGLGSDASSRRAEQSARDRLAAEQAYEKLSGGGGKPDKAETAVSRKNMADSARSDKADTGAGRSDKADFSYTAPDTGSSAPKDFVATRKSATLEGRVKGLEAQRAASAGGAPSVPSQPLTGGSVPKAPAVPPYKAGNVAQKKAQLGAQRREAAKNAANAPKTAPAPIRGGDVPVPPLITMGNSIQNRVWGLEAQRDRLNAQQPDLPENPTVVSGTGSTVPQAPPVGPAPQPHDPDKARRQEAMRNAKSPELRRREEEERKRNLENYTLNQFMRDRWKDGQ